MSTVHPDKNSVMGALREAFIDSYILEDKLVVQLDNMKAIISGLEKKREYIGISIMVQCKDDGALNDALCAFNAKHSVVHAYSFEVSSGNVIVFHYDLFILDGVHMKTLVRAMKKMETTIMLSKELDHYITR